MRPLRSVYPLLAGALCLIPALAAAVPFDLQVYDRTEARYLPTYQFQGRTYVVGKPGNEYSLSLRNQSGERVMVVGSVDGVNIVSGETASAQQSGYVLTGWQTADITGWRKSLSNTAAFYFTEHDNSYAARTGRPNDVGVIGAAVFRERRVQPPIQPPRPIQPWREQGNSNAYPYGSAAPKESRADAAPGAQSAQSAQAEQSAQPAQPSRETLDMLQRAEKSLGTGHGRIEESRTRYTDFQRASSTPDTVITLYYNTYSNLLAMGVPVWRDDGNRYAGKPEPRPFPRDPRAGFVPDPR